MNEMTFFDQIPPATGRKHRITPQSDGSSIIEDITIYEQEGTPVTAALLQEMYDTARNALPNDGTAASANTLSLRTVSTTSEATGTGVFRVAAGEGNGMPNTNGYLMVQFSYTYESGAMRYMRFAMNMVSFAIYTSGDSGTPSWTAL